MRPVVCPRNANNSKILFFILKESQLELSAWKIVIKLLLSRVLPQFGNLMLVKQLCYLHSLVILSTSIN